MQRVPQRGGLCIEVAPFYEGLHCIIITLSTCFRRKKTMTYEKLPLSRHIKKQPVSEPVYSGH